MKKIIIIILICLITGIGIGWLIFSKHNTGLSEVTAERKVLYYRNPMNPSITSKVPKKDEMGMDYVPVYEGEPGENTIRINPATQQNIGVTTEIVEKRELTRNIRTMANITYDETRLYIINTKISGYVEKLFVDYTGQLVKKGQPLLEIYSPDLVSTQEEYLQAVKYRNGISGGSPISIQGAEQLVESAKLRLLNWDISEKEISELEKRGTPQKTMTIYSPANGIVTEKMVIPGQNIEAGMALYKIADLSTVWGIAQIYQYELQWIKTGDKAELHLSYLPGTAFEGRVTYIYPYLDNESKTAQVRIEIKNSSDYEFKPGMFADVTIKLPLKLKTIAVPEQAIIHTGTRDVAIIALNDGYFKPVNVILGARGDEGFIQIIKGLNEGDKIVTSSQFLIDSESNLNAAFKNMNNSEETNSQNKMQNMEQPANGQNPEKKSESTSPSGKQTNKNDIIRKEPIDVEAIDQNKDGKVYEDVMDWNVISDQPGNCPICGMKLQEVSVKQAELNLKANGFKVK
jgi:RND family efflux transporter MFP subunit